MTATSSRTPTNYCGLYQCWTWRKASEGTRSGWSAKNISSLHTSRLLVPKSRKLQNRGGSTAPVLCRHSLPVRHLWALMCPPMQISPSLWRRTFVTTLLTELWQSCQNPTTTGTICAASSPDRIGAVDPGVVRLLGRRGEKWPCRRSENKRTMSACFAYLNTT